MSDDTSLGNRLLVIDDDPGICRVIARVAERTGYEVMTTADPAAFLNAARQWRPSVIILDLHIPGTDGIQLLRGLAADKCTAHVVVASGADIKVLETAQQLGQQRGLDIPRALQKPIRLDDLREMLRGFHPVPRTLVAVDLAGALKAGQLSLQYHPKLDCRARRIAAVEAVAQWRHPTLGVIPPEQLPALAEQGECARALTDWTVAEAGRRTAEWRAAGLDLTVAVNIPAKDLEDLDLPDRLERLCQEAGIEPSAVMVDLGESSVMRAPMHTMDVLTRLRLKEFELAIDDFGTGYSSLVQLQKLPFSEIGIDASFVRDMIRTPSCRVVVEIIADLAHRLGLRSAAKGVEDEAALDSLAALGCDLAQGAFIGGPLDSEQVAAFVQSYDTPLQSPGEARTG